MLRTNFELENAALPEHLLDVVNMRKKEITQSTDRLRNLKTFLLNHNSLPGVQVDSFDPDVLFKRYPGNNPAQHNVGKSTGRVRIDGSGRALSDRSSSTQPKNTTIKQVHNTSGIIRQNSQSKDNTPDNSPLRFFKAAVSADVTPDKHALRLPLIASALFGSETKANQTESGIKGNRSLSLPNLKNMSRGGGSARRSAIEKEEDNNIDQLKSALLSIFKIDDDENNAKRSIKKKKKYQMAFLPESQIYQDTDGTGVGPLLKKIDSYLYHEMEEHFIERLDEKYGPEIEKVVEKYGKGKDPFEFSWKVDPSILKLEEDNVQNYLSFKSRNLRAERKKIKRHIL